MDDNINMDTNTTPMVGKVLAVLVALLLVVVMVYPIINTVATGGAGIGTNITIDNEGAGWLKLGYNSGADYSFNVGYETITVDDEETQIFKVGEQTGDYEDMICYADPQRTLFISGDSWYLLTVDNTPSVHKFTDTASVSNASGTLTINDGSTVIYSGASPTWAYVPDTDGNYGFFTNGGLTLEAGKPKVAVGDFAGIFAYNERIVLPQDVELNVTMDGDYTTGDVTWEAEMEVETEETLPTDSQPSMAVNSSGYAEMPVFGSANPVDGTRVGDLFYKFSGANATVVGYSSSIDWSTFTTIPDTVEYNSITYTVKSIGYGAFKNCTSLALTELPAGLTNIDTEAFYGCTSLALTSLPNSITNISTRAFNACTNLALTSLPSELTSIGIEAFYRCTNLALTELPAGLTSIGQSAFSGCTSLALTSLPSGLTSIGNSAFYGCTNLALTSLPSGLTSIGSSAFSSCTNLALTELPAGLTRIDSNVFKGCTNLALTELPAGLTSISSQAFSGCTSLALTELPAGLTSIDSSAFSSCTNLALTSLPSGLTSISSQAFSGCTNLALTSLPSGLISIGQGAFSGCTNLALTELPAGLTRIDSSAFSSCTNLALTSLPSGLTSIDSSVFYRCTSLALTELPAGLTSIGQGAFNRCTSLALTELPAGLTSIGNEAFYGCTSLTWTSLPSGLISIGQGAFSGCTSLALTSLPSGLTSIGNSAFSSCTNLNNLIILGSPTIGINAFQYTGIKEVLNLGETEITTTSYGLNADSVQDHIPAIGYIAPTHIHIQEGLDGVPLALLKIVPILLIVSILLVLVIPMIQSRTD